KIVYNANGGTGTMSDTTGVTDQTVQVATNSFTRAGYTFTGWNTKADGSGTDYSEGADYALTATNLALYAQWSANPSKIVYDANGGEGLVTDTEGVTDQTVKVATNTFTRDGYTFVGWNTKADGTGTSFSENSNYILTADNIVLYAQWKEIEEIPESPATPDNILEIVSICALSSAAVSALLFALARRRRI
ncbi:InlB B-repeat-containing protein, partial [Candidatus Saccharibacteria bacterium]|nr:InlB B-repeat-containing protein [Candidatus Saccharibacteria bacterium]